MKLKARLARKSDLYRIGVLLKGFHEEAGLVPMNPYNVEDTVRALLELGRVWVVEDERGVIGMAGLSEGEFWYNRDEALFETQFCYVLPGETRAGHMLLLALRAFGNRVGVPILVNRTNPTRPGKCGGLGWLADKVGFIPMGRTTMINGDGHVWHLKNI